MTSLDNLNLIDEIFTAGQEIRSEIATFDRMTEAFVAETRALTDTTMRLLDRLRAREEVADAAERAISRLFPPQKGSHLLFEE
jgi:hypothetical protein